VSDLEAKPITAADLVNTAQQYLSLIGRPDEAARIRDNNIINRLRGVLGLTLLARPHAHTNKPGDTSACAFARSRNGKRVWSEGVRQLDPPEPP
jgi:hypothetical protein